FAERLPPGHPNLAMARRNLGEVLHSLGRREEAWRHLSAASAAWAAHAARTSAGSARRDHAALIAKQPHSLDGLLTAAAGPGEWREGRCRELLVRTLDGKAISASAQRAWRQLLLAGADARTRGQADRLVALQRRLAGLLAQGPGRDGPEAYRRACA